tara:strand:+ start:27697 stop:28257 length:561 start_codon:yes stop_codon:yes gene_type:complete
MSDLPEKLRKCVDYAYETRHHEAVEALNDSADRIEQLERENKGLKDSVTIQKHVSEDLTEYRDKLKQELDELAGHVEKLNSAFAKFEKRHEEIEYEDNIGVFFESQDFDDLTDAFVKPPQASLAEVKAKAAKEGIIAAALSLNAVKPERHHSYADGHEYGYYVAYQLVFAFAEKHAQQIRNGKDGE